ncbi:PAS domain S-box protein, partial [Lentimicrobium sp. L6]|uniref:PAS domain S-box protein n=1 Tax=Lentimicrobium sp. L6 TaxID=2735916 RepID=UPI0015532E48
WKMVKSGKEWHGEFHNKKKNGELFWEKATVSPIIDENGHIINFLKVAEDITEKKKYEKVQKVLFNISNAANLNNNLAEFIGIIHKELEKIIDTTNFYVALYDEEKDYFTFPFYSDEQDQFHKVPAAKTLTKYIIKTNQTLMVDAVLNQKLKEEGFINDMGSVSKIWLGSPLVVEGKAIGAIAVQSYTNENAFNKSDEEMFSFIAEQISISINRKNIQEKHARSETRFKRLFEDLGDAIFVTRVGGNHGGQILEANSAASQQTGYSRDELLSMNISQDIYVDGSCDYNVQDMEISLLKGNTIKTIEKKRRKNGSEYWTEMIVTPIEFQDVAASISINRDITDRIETEAQLIKALAKAEESDRLKSSFLANMSHEIRTPMNGIMGFTSLLMDENISLGEVKEFSSVIERSSQRLLNTINDIMDISRIEAGQVDNQQANVNIGEQMDDIHRLFGLEAEYKGLKFIMNKGFENKDSVIRVDEDKLYSIITNLIKNAIKFTETGSVEFSADKKTNGFYFKVKDTGIGILKDKQESVFHRFVQADLSLSSKYEGAGLGLSIVKAYLEVLSGEIRLESEEGKGTTFYVFVPFQ